MLGSSACVTCRQAAENRSWYQRRWCDVSGSSAGSSSAATTTTGRSSRQPNACACSSTYAASRARRAKTSRRKSPWYLFSTAEIASSRVISSAATVAARSRACTSSGVERAVPVHAHQPGQVGATGGDPQRPDLADPQRRTRLTDPLHAQPPALVEQVGLCQRDPVVRVEVGGALPAVGRGDHHPGAEDRRDLLGDPVQVAALQDDVGEGGVQGVDPRQRRGRVDPGIVARPHRPAPLVTAPFVTEPTDRWQNLTSRRLPSRD